MAGPHPSSHSVLSNPSSTASPTAKQPYPLSSIATARGASPFITGFLPHLRIPHCSLPHSFPLFLCQTQSFVGLGNFHFPLSATYREPGSDWFPSLGPSPQHSYCPSNVLSLANDASFHLGGEERATVVACYMHVHTQPAHEVTPVFKGCLSHNSHTSCDTLPPLTLKSWNPWGTSEEPGCKDSLVLTSSEKSRGTCSLA